MCTHTHRNHPIPALSSSLHSLPLAVLPEEYILPSFPLTALPLSLTFLLSTASAVYLYLHPVLCWFGGQGIPSSLPHARFVLPHYAVPSCSSSPPAKAEKFPCQGSLCCKYILPERKARLHQLTVKACTAVICLGKSFEHHKQQRDSLDMVPFL